MDSNIKDGASYLDGVPVKISSQFLPPRTVTIPLALDANCSADLLEEQYDFSFERSVLEFSRRRQSELLNRVQCSPKETEPCSEGQEPGLKQTSSQCVLPWQSDTILQPEPQQHLPKVACPSINDVKSKFNLSDFENDSSSPFDYMELQTINDLEELSSVFQGLHNDKKDHSSEGATEDVCGVESSPVENDETTSCVAKSISFPLPQNSWKVAPEKIPNSLSEDFAFGIKGASLSSYRNGSRPSLSCPMSSPMSGMKDFSCDNISYSTLSQVPYISSNAGAQVAKATSLRGCRSYSDLHQLSNAEVPMDTRSRTPPSDVPKSTGEALSLNEEHFGKTLNDTANVILNRENSAYEELEGAAQQFVDSVTEMGFVQGQVARAVKHLGIDEKKVVEHLCHIQALQESGYESSEAEAALHLHDYNRDQAKEFLDLVNQFQDLGFEKDAIKKALVQNKNDWNKTIDALLP